MKSFFTWPVLSCAGIILLLCTDFSSGINYLDVLKSQSSLDGKKLVELDYEAQLTVAELLVKSVIPSYLRDAINSHLDSSLFSQKEGFLSVEEVEMHFRGDKSFTSKVNDKCADDLTKYFQEIMGIVRNPMHIFNETSVWAVQMIDSWGKIPEGILTGHVNALGDYDECVNVRSHPSISDPFRGEYCFTYLVPAGLLASSPETLRQNKSNLSRKAVKPIDFLNEMANPLLSTITPSLITCIPSSCTPEDYQELMLSLFSRTPQIFPYVLFCVTDEKPDLDAGAISMIVILSILVTTILVATIADGVIHYRTSLSHLKSKIGIRILVAFSLLTNVKKWANTSSAEGGFGCIHGIRFFSTCWVLLSHTMLVVSLQAPSWNIIDINHLYERHWSIYFILNGYFSVDTFFTMSGLLAAYSILKALEKGNGWVNPLQLYLHRFLRLTPTYGLLIGILANLYKYVGSGPVFTFAAEGVELNCRRYWWHNLLYINNLVWYDPEDGKAMCEGESWYIANDMQFFILCPLFMIIIYRWKRIGLGVLGTASLASVLIPGIYTGVHELAPTTIFWKPSERNDTLYMKPWHRIGPYLVGMWMGYLLYKIGKKPVRLPKLGVIAGWMLSTSVALALLLGIIPYYDPQNEDSAIGAGFYAGLSRFAWGIVICWIIFACSKGYGGWVNSFLSWKAFVPLGRLTFCVYLSSLSIQLLLQLSFRQPMVFDMYHMVNIFFSHVIMCFLVGFVFTMAFESPFIALEKLLFARETQPQPQTQASSTVPHYAKSNIAAKDTIHGDLGQATSKSS